MVMIPYLHQNKTKSQLLWCNTGRILFGDARLCQMAPSCPSLVEVIEFEWGRHQSLVTNVNDRI